MIVPEEVEIGLTELERARLDPLQGQQIELLRRYLIRTVGSRAQQALLAQHIGCSPEDIHQLMFEPPQYADDALVSIADECITTLTHLRGHDPTYYRFKRQYDDLANRAVRIPAAHAQGEVAVRNYDPSEHTSLHQLSSRKIERLTNNGNQPGEAETDSARRVASFLAVVPQIILWLRGKNDHTSVSLKGNQLRYHVKED